MTSKHTPGPWVYNGEEMRDANRIIHIEGSRIPVAYAADFNTYERDVEVDANARLIAAAPEMLTALRYALPALEQRARNTTDPQAINADGFMVEQTRALLARIEGEQI